MIAIDPLQFHDESAVYATDAYGRGIRFHAIQLVA